MATEYVTDGPWGTGTGAPLPADVIDENFYGHETRIADIEANPPLPASISNIQVIGSQLKIFLTNGQEFGPYTLPIANYQWKGDYNPGQHYYELDIISVTGRGLYLVRIEHDTDPDEPFDPAVIDGDGDALYQLIFGEDSYIYNIGFFYPGRPGAGLEDVDAAVAAHIFAQEAYLPVLLPNSIARLRVAPQADLVFNMYKRNGTGTPTDGLIGSLTFLAGSVVGILNFMAEVQFEPKDVVWFRKPALIDADARELIMTLVALRGVGVGS